MEAKVLAAIMKLQAAQIMLSNEGIHNDLSTNYTEFGGIELTAFVHNTTEEKIASDILEAYDFEGADIYRTTHDENMATEFKTYKIAAFISDIK